MRAILRFFTLAAALGAFLLAAQLSGGMVLRQGGPFSADSRPVNITGAANVVKTFVFARKSSET